MTLQDPIIVTDEQDLINTLLYVKDHISKLYYFSFPKKTITK